MRIKQILVLLVAICLTLSLTSKSFAVTNNDSLTLSEVELTDMKENEFDTIVKLYNGGHMYRFSQRCTISEIISQCLSEEYMIISTEEVHYKQYYNGEIHDIANKRGDWRDFVSYALNPAKVFEPSVEVNSIYCLDGTANHDGAYIYFITSAGDYVLFKENLNTDDMYLFPLEDFYQFAEGIASGWSEDPDVMIGSGISTESLDISAYKFYERENSYAGVLIVTAVMLCIALLYVFFIRHKTVRNHRKVR